MSKDRRAPVALCEKRIPLTMPRSLYEGIVIAAAEDLKSVNGLYPRHHDCELAQAWRPDWEGRMNSVRRAVRLPSRQRAAEPGPIGECLFFWSARGGKDESSRGHPWWSGSRQPGRGVPSAPTR